MEAQTTSSPPRHTSDRSERWCQAFKQVGWFVPAFVPVGVLDSIAEIIISNEGAFDQNQLERTMALIYTPERLVSMALHRYPVTPLVKDYCVTIGEAIQAHLIGLHHIAIGGLVPTIEGIAKRFAKERGLEISRNQTKIIKKLMESYNLEILSKEIGVFDELLAMLNSFDNFSSERLYIDSTKYELSDKTNRHGIVHGAFSDTEYGRPLNFYKAISAIDVLVFTSIIHQGGSVFVPAQTDDDTLFLNSIASQAKLQFPRIGPTT